MNLNKAFILGRLTQDPDVKTLPSGQNVANFSLATNRFWTNNQGEKQESTEFHNIVLFGRLADIAASYLRKGQLMLVEGRIQTRSWQDQNGNNRYKTEVIGENLQLGPKSQNSGNNSVPGNFPNSSPSQQRQNEPSIPVINIEDDNNGINQKESEENTDIQIKDIPF